jgi:hypothetical protein
MVLQVMLTLNPADRDVIDRSGSHFHLRVLPYRVSEGKVDGAVITLISLPVK